MKLLFLLATLTLPVFGAGFRVGTARENITPDLPFWLSGYAARTQPADHVLQDIWAKALALEDEKGYRVVIVTTDLIGLPSEVADEVALRCAKQFA